MDQERPKNESSQNQTKPTPLCPTRRIDSSHIIFFANGHCMQNLSRSDRFPKQAKKSTSQSQQVVLLTSTVQHVTST